MRIAINGFGRIGRIFLRTILAKPGIDVIAINDQADTATLAHLFKYDSVHRGFKGTVTHDEGNIYVNGNKIKTCNKPDPALLPWKDLDIDLVIESTGKFITADGATKHLTAGAKQVIISAPPAIKVYPLLYWP
jgi:glyceraldehyde 3-phosphate dehydrogenase